MDREHGLRPRRYRLVDSAEVEVEGVGVDVDEDGCRAGEPDDVGGRGEGVSRDDHLVAWPDPEREHGEVESGGAVGDGHRVRDAARRRDEPFELLHLRPHRQRARLEDGAHLGELLLPELREREAD